MRIRSSTLSLAALVLLAIPAAAMPARSEHPATPSAASHPLDSSSIIATTRSSPMSTSTSGNANQVSEHLDRYVTQFGGSGVHHVAASAARAAIGEVTKAQPEGSTFSISVSETVSESSGSINIGYNVTKAPAAPAPQPAASSAPSASSALASGGSASGTSASGATATGATDGSTGQATSQPAGQPAS
jgi:hypothetical protein